MKERELAEALGGIHAPDGLRQRIMELGERPRGKTPALKYAVPAALAVVLILGAALWPRPVSELVKVPQEAPRTAAPMQPAAPGPQGQAPAVHPTPARPPVPGKKTIFLAVSAAGYGGVGETVNLAQNQTVTIQTEGNQSSLGSGTKDEKTGKYEYQNLYQFPLKCVGDGITKVTYEISNGTLMRKVPLTKEQAQSTDTRKELGLENGEEITKDPESGEMHYYGFQPLGQSYTVEDYGTNDTGTIIIDYTVESDSSPDSLLKSENTHQFWKLFVKEVQGTQLKVTATFAEGATCEKNVALSTDDGVNIKATLLD